MYVCMTVLMLVFIQNIYGFFDAGNENVYTEETFARMPSRVAVAVVRCGSPPPPPPPLAREAL